MAEWAINASPIIVFARLGLLDTLEFLVPDWVIPMGVVEEIKAGPKGNAAAAWLTEAEPRHIVSVSAINPAVGGWDLGKGESEVLTYCLDHKGCGVVLDDYAARKCAAALGNPLRGTLGLLILAKRQGLLAAVAPILERLPSVGFRITSALIDEAKNLAGE
jgi:predicted nucleic acid-binding protein